MDIFSVLTLIGGLALFLYGMDNMGSGLKKLSGGRLENILERLTSNRAKGFLLGLAVTAVIQSSSATTVMLVGFVNSGIMKLSQTISIIMGANIGTTVTAWILSLSGINGESFFVKILKPSSFTPILAVIGVIMTMSSGNSKKQNIGEILVGFAILMFGMETMSSSMDGLKDSAAFAKMLIMFSNPVMGILVGTALTAIIQSSSASVGILQALSLTGAIPFSTALPIILGQNIGTTITPVLSAINGNTSSKRVAVSCVYIKMIGVVIFAVLFYTVNVFYPFPFMNSHVSALSIAIIHTTFNIFSTVILMPFCKNIEKLAIVSIKSKGDDEENKFAMLDDRFLSSPSFALKHCQEYVYQMADLAKESIDKAISLINNFDAPAASYIAKAEKDIDKYEDKIGTYLVKLSSENLTHDESKESTELLHCIGDFERMGDHALNIMQTSEEIKDKSIQFSPDAKKEVEVMAAAVMDVVDITVHAFKEKNSELATRVEPLEQVVDKLKSTLKSNHIERLQRGECTTNMGFVFSDIITNFERIADHCSNIAVSLIQSEHEGIEAHEYLHNIKHDNFAFDNLYDAYKKKYSVKKVKKADVQ